MTHQTSFLFNPPKPKLDKKFPKTRKVELAWSGANVELMIYDDKVGVAKDGETVTSWDSSDYWLSESELEDSLKNDERPQTNEPEDVQDRIDAGWDIFTEEFDSLLNVVSDGIEHRAGKFYRVSGRNLGWEHRSGMMYVAAKNGLELLQKITPKSEYNLRVQICLSPDEPHRPMLAILCGHHDAPTGEYYFVHALNKAEYKQWDNEEITMK